jgi:carbamoyl-phosphate synthase large subunit
MEVVHDQSDLDSYMHRAVQVSNQSPVLLDRFLDNATEVDVDAVCDGADVVVAGIMEHIEEAGVHSGDSACSLPPFTLRGSVLDELREQTRRLALGLNVVGLMNVQFAVQDKKVYVLEVNPRASRTVPFVSKATGVPWAKVAARCMAGRSLQEQGVIAERVPHFYSVKEAVFPFTKFAGVDSLLGPEMKSTGEVMGVGRTFGEAFAKSQQAAGNPIPERGCAFVSVRDKDKAAIVEIARELAGHGLILVATRGTADYLRERGLECGFVKKVGEGHPNSVDMMRENRIQLIINTTAGKQAIADSFSIRREALMHKVSYVTTVAAARAVALGLGHQRSSGVYRLQSLHQEFAR